MEPVYDKMSEPTGPDDGQSDDKAVREGAVTVGKSLKRIFGQDDALARVQAQRASRSLLMNEARLNIFLHLCDCPCDHARGFAQRLGIAPTAAAWHAKALLRTGILESAFSKGKALLWPQGMVKPDDAAMVGELTRDRGLGILDAISRAGGKASPAQIAGMTRQSRQMIAARLEGLESSGVVRREGSGRAAAYSVSERAAAAAAGYREAARDCSARLLAILEGDGLFPRGAVFKGTVLRVDVSLPSGRRRLKLECDPLAHLERTLRARR